MLTRSPRTQRFFLAAAVCAALVGSGCGEDEGDKAAEYRDALEEASDTFKQEQTKALSTIQAASQAKSRDQYSQGIEQLQRATDGFKKELDELDTPSDAENEEEAVTESVDEFNQTIGRINAAVQADDEKQVRAEAANVEASAAALDQAVETLNDAVR